jgi:biotin-dependent carboxylase-like uncharacterized protein
VIRFERAAAFALTGAAAEATLDDIAQPMWWSGFAEAGQVLRLMPSSQGVWTYFSVAGGISCDPVMGSRSTDLKIGIGGPFSGKAIPKGATIEIGEPDPHLSDCIAACGGFAVAPPRRAVDEHGLPILRVVVAREYAFFRPEDCAAFWLDPWQVTRDSNRMGYKLTGPKLETDKPLSLPSYPLVPGIIQVPPAGQPIVQLAEANTCGGYPKFGVIIEHDIPALVQTPPGRSVRMQQIGRTNAVLARRAHADFLSRVRAAVDQVRTVMA